MSEMKLTELCAVNQAAYLLKRQLESQGCTFAEQGGFTENLHRTRTKARGTQHSDRQEKDKQP